MSGKLKNVGKSTLYPKSVDERLDFFVHAFYSYSSELDKENFVQVTSGD